MDARLDYNSSEVLQKFGRHINAAAAAVHGSRPCRRDSRTWC